MKRSKKIDACVPSLTLSLAEEAARYEKAGESVIHFGTGEPDFVTPEYIREGAKAAIDAGHTKYDAVAGVAALRQAIVRYIEKEQGIRYSPNQVIVGSGAKTSLSVALQTILDPGDEVIIPRPYWVSYTEMVKLAGGVPVIVKTDEAADYKMTPQQLRDAVTDRTAAVLLNTPSNPTGAFYTEAELAALAEVILEKDLWIISDEIYEAFVYDGKKTTSIAALGEDVKAHTIRVSGFSKTFAMTGWRLGYACAPDTIIEGMKKIQGHNISHPCTIAQYAGLTALEEEGDTVARITALFDKRRHAMMERLDGLSGISYIHPVSTFYIFANVRDVVAQHPYGITSAFDLSRELLTRKKVVTIPGEAFGVTDHIRFSFATSMEEIEEGFDRIEGFLKNEE
jgi:aspartate aminotransferase